MKVYYHDDLDGRLSAFHVMQSTYKDQYLSEYIPMTHEATFNPSDIMPDELVIFVDFIVKPDIFKTILKYSKKIFWVDHHINTLKAYDEAGIILPGLQSDGIAACELSFLFFREGISKNYGNLERARQSIPLYTQLIGDRDTMQKKFGKAAMHFALGVESEDTKPDSAGNVWQRCEAQGEEAVKRYAGKGAVIDRFMQKIRKELVKRIGYETKIDGHSAFAINDRGGADFSDYLLQTHDLVICYLHNGAQYLVSIYSNKIDAGKIALHYGGGGHKAVAGFQCKTLPFKAKESFTRGASL